MPLCHRPLSSTGPGIDQCVWEGAAVWQLVPARGEADLLEAVNGWQSQSAEAFDIGDSQAFERWLHGSVDCLGGLDIYIGNVSTRFTSED